MRCRIIVAMLCLLGVASRPAAAAQTMTLVECYQQALEYSRVVAISKEQIQQAKARFTQALGEILPKITFEASELLQDPAAQAAETGNNVGQTLTRLSRPELRLHFEQNLFRGFQEIQALKLSKLDKKRQILLEQDVERLLMQDVATAFITIALIEREISTTEKIISVSRSQVGELKKNIDLGKSRESEGTEQLADLSLLEADLERQRGQRRVAYEMLSFLTGLDPQPPIAIDGSLPIAPEPLDYYVARAQGRPDVRATQTELQIAKGETKLRQGELLPQAALNANVYPYRVGFLSEIDWDAEFTLAVPLFNGVTIGRIQESKSLAKQAEFRAEQQRRIAVHETKENYEALESSQRQFAKFKRATEVSERSYRQQSRDFQLGLLNNFNLLQSQRTWFTAMRQRDVSQAQMWADWIKLLIVSGVLP